MPSIYFCIGCGKEIEKHHVCTTCYERALKRNIRTCPVCELQGIRHRHATTGHRFVEVHTCGWCGNTVHKAVPKERQQNEGKDLAWYPGLVPGFVPQQADEITGAMAVTVRART